MCSLNQRAIVVLIFLCALMCAVPFPAVGAEVMTAPTDNDFVDIRSVDPTIVVDLRYASSDNFVRRALYPVNMPALVRFSVARRLAIAQAFVKPYGYRLKIWDAYRPKAAQAAL